MGKLSSGDKAALRGLYDARYEKLGRSHSTVGWGSVEDQLLRFEVLMRGLDPRGKRILDVGCGLGDLVPYLDKRFGADYAYEGLDLSEALVADARRSFAGPQRAFRVADILEDPVEKADIVLISGALNFKVEDNRSYSRAMLAKIFELCREAACSNFLSTYVDWQDSAKNFHHSPEETFGWGKELTRWAALHHDYPLWEFTLQLFRAPRKEAP